MKCGMILSVSPETGEETPCTNEDTRRHFDSKPDEGCCDECFHRMLTSGDFDIHELEEMYPLLPVPV